MRYAILKRINDVFILLNIEEQQEIAVKTAMTLERQFLTQFPLSQRLNLMLIYTDDGKLDYYWEIILKKLGEFGFTLPLNQPNELFRQIDYIQHELNDKQLHGLLESLDIQTFYSFAFDKETQVETVFFFENQIASNQGYVYYQENNRCFILFNPTAIGYRSKIFSQFSAKNPLVTPLTEQDNNHQMLKLLLKNHPKNFISLDNILYYVGGGYPYYDVLFKVNSRLTNPFFEIKTIKFDKLIEIQTSPDFQNLKIKPLSQAYLSKLEEISNNLITKKPLINIVENIPPTYDPQPLKFFQNLINFSLSKYLKGTR